MWENIKLAHITNRDQKILENQRNIGAQNAVSTYFENKMSSHEKYTKDQ